jgi:hypothetical protein
MVVMLDPLGDGLFKFPRIVVMFQLDHVLH